MEEDWASNFERALWSYKKKETDREIGETNTGMLQIIMVETNERLYKS